MTVLPHLGHKRPDPATSSRSIGGAGCAATSDDPIGVSIGPTASSTRSLPDVKAEPAKLPNHVLRVPTTDGTVLPDLVRRWADSGHQVLSLDLRGHGTPLSRQEHPAHRAMEDPRQWTDVRGLESALGRLGVVTVEGWGGLCWIVEIIVPVLRAAQRLRTWTGRPDLLVIDDASRILGEPAVPPDALNLDAGGHILVMRTSPTRRRNGTRQEAPAH